jgi:adenosylhomocysteine nucleosidase
MGPAVHNRQPECVKTGILAALPEELGRWRGGQARSFHGLELFEEECAGHEVLACVSGAGKVNAARAAAFLIAAGVGRLLVVGTSGGLRAHLGPGEMVHCTRAIQTDLALRDGRELTPDAKLLSTWQETLPARSGWFLTGDRPVMSFWRRMLLIRAFSGDCVAEMETAAAAAVAHKSDLPWAALRSVTDLAGTFAATSFQVHYPVQAPRAADSIPELLCSLADLSPGDRTR